MKSGKAIYKILTTDSDVSALVSTRVYPNVAKNSTGFPFIIYEVDNELPTATKDGVSILDTDDVMISIYSKTYAEASDLARKVRTALDRTSGTYENVIVQSIKYDGYNDLFDNDVSDEGVYRKALDFKIRIENTTTSTFTNTYSLDFDGVDDYVVFADADVFTPNTSGANRGFTVSFWFKSSSAASQNIISKNAFVGGNQYEWKILTRFNGHTRFVLYSSNNSAIYLQFDIDTALANDTWYHIAFTWDLGTTSSSIKGYLNGVEKTDGSGGTFESDGTFVSVSNTTATLNFAKEFNSYGQMLLDEVAIFDDAKTASAITDIYNSGTPNDLSALSYLVGYWRNGDGATYPTIPDDSTNSNSGTMTNMASGDIQTDVP